MVCITYRKLYNFTQQKYKANNEKLFQQIFL